jgi:CheY-like chemotaxis protein
MSRSLILAVHPDPRQAALLRQALGTGLDAEVVIVNSPDAAIAAIAKEVPDLVLLHAFLPPRDENEVMAFVGALPHTEHVQVISIPVLQCPSERILPRHLLNGRKARLPGAVSSDPRLFAAEVAEYLSQALAIKTEVQQREAGMADASDRRRALRWSPRDVPWVSSVQLGAGERADLVNVSSTGALLRTRTRPKLTSLKYVGRPSESRTSLTFRLVTGKEVHALAQVIRCHVAALHNGGVLYGVAYRFNGSVPLELPHEEPGAPPTIVVKDAPALSAPSAPLAAGFRYRVFSDTRRLQHELPALSTNRLLSPAARNAISELTTIDASLLQIGTTLAGARRTCTTPTQLADVASRLAPRIQQLRVLRGQVIDGFSEDDLVLIAAQTGQPVAVES